VTLHILSNETSFLLPCHHTFSGGHTVNKEVIANKEENDRLEEREGALIKKLQWQLDELRAREGVVTNEKEAIARSEREELLDLQARMGKL